ncbi:MAG: hypothetical protein KAU20_04090 [Nanoarchaeota archaeon]|nr:hypothetical protein [Nanoarchaeota archaeon]
MYKCHGIPDILQGCSIELIDLIKGGRNLVESWKTINQKDIKEIKYFCKLPVIYFTDPNTPKLKEDPPVIIFNGKYSKNKISYDGFISNKNYFNIFKKGNCIEVKDNRIDIFFGNKFVNSLKIKPRYKHHIIIPK